MAHEFPKLDPVVVTWIDSASFDHEWRCIDHLEECCGIVCKTAGWLMLQDETKVVVALDLSENNRCNGITVVPAGCIISVVKLRRR